MPVCVLTCEACIYTTHKVWNISIFGLGATHAQEMRARYPELNLGTANILSVDAWPNLRSTDPRFEFQQRVEATFSNLLRNKPDAILNLATSYLTALEDFTEYRFYQKNRSYISNTMSSAPLPSRRRMGLKSGSLLWKQSKCMANRLQSWHP
ncbi:uncharacterized protein LOC110861891 [Folsomia candida]|uniref:uncharacterized protein LOC110861891 n=1 Tax=Folsomia candida TaxID=158441 RepID=UPI0016055495|nr:uncharacterized protein LOC110861891 [Folsomia candida]